jgi:hypothetical protein
MTSQIASLTDQQAVHAVKLFYDFSPPELWEGEEKPSPERIKTIAAALVKQAPTDVRPAVAALVEEDQQDYTPARAEVSRLILTQLWQSPTFRPYVDRAVETASRPSMAIDPITGAFVIAILLATSRKVQGGAVVVDAIKALRLPELLHELPPVLKALPEGVWKALMKKP